MQGRLIDLYPGAAGFAPNGSVALLGERIVYGLVGLLLIGAIIPIGPTIPVRERGAVATACATDVTRWSHAPCAVDGSPALASAFTSVGSDARLPRSVLVFH